MGIGCFYGMLVACKKAAINAIFRQGGLIFMIISTKTKRFAVMLTVIVTLFMVLITAGAGQAIEPLMLTGIVKNVDIRGSLITIALLNRDCKGVKQFRIDYTRFNNALDYENKKVDFYFDGETCPASEIRTITRIGR
jgi:hypothetical protein